MLQPRYLPIFGAYTIGQEPPCQSKSTLQRRLRSSLGLISTTYRSTELERLGECDCIGCEAIVLQPLTLLARCRIEADILALSSAIGTIPMDGLP
jgi:hypothetical protein